MTTYRDGATVSVDILEARTSSALAAATADSLAVSGQVDNVPKWHKYLVTWEDSGELTAYTVPAAHEIVISGCFVNVTTAWDGTGADIDVGAGGTGNSIYDGSVDAIDMTTISGYTPTAQPFIKGPAGATVTVTVTPGSTPSTGAATVYLLMSLIPTADGTAL